MLLGDDAPAHVSISHFDCTRDAALSCWEIFLRESPTSAPVELVSLSFTPLPLGYFYVPEGGIGVRLDAALTKPLAHLREKAVEAAGEIGASLLGSRDFHPHMSLAVLRETRIKDVDLDPTVVPSTFVASVALGRLGSYGTFPEILARE
jgi:hypothetical protein